MRRFRKMVVVGMLTGVGAFAGCIETATETPSTDTTPTVDQAPDRVLKKEQPKPAAKIKRLKAGKNIEVEIEGDKRRVRVAAYVCQREKTTFLEQLLTRKNRKEHEAILAADIDARELHFALTLAGAEAGKTVQFRPKPLPPLPPTGTKIKVFLEYKTKNGKDMRVAGASWIKNKKTGKEFESDWVFAGSVFIPDPNDKTKVPYYGANEGDIITLVNFETSCLDVPFYSTKDNAENFTPFTERIPAVKTPVTVVLEPMVAKKK